MKKPVIIIVCIMTGIIIEIVSIMVSFSGSNLLHGGRPNIIVNVLLPGIGIVNHLSQNIPYIIPLSMMFISLFQFPVYGAIVGRDIACASLSKITKTVLILHLAAIATASYGQLQFNQWQDAADEHGACIRANASAEDITANSTRIVELNRWIEQSRREIDRIKTAKEQGTSFTPDPEAGYVRTLTAQELELEQRWERYKNSGGTAKSPEAVTVIESPCGPVPRAPYLF